MNLMVQDQSLSSKYFFLRDLHLIPESWIGMDILERTEWSRTERS